MRPNTRMSNVTRGVALLLIGLIAEPTPTAVAGPMTTSSTAQQAADPWDTLRALPTGSRVLLKLNTGTEIEGRVVTVRPDSVVLDENQVRAGAFTANGSLHSPLTFNRPDVQQLSLVSTPSLSVSAQAVDSWELNLPAAPVGSQLLLTLASGGRIECRLREARSDTVVVNDCQVREGQVATRNGMQEAVTFSRQDVTRVTMVNPPTKFVSNGRPNAATVRFLVTSWSVGKKVDLQTIAGDRVQGRIASIEPVGFTVVNKTAARKLEYASVQSLRQARMSVGKKIGIAAALYGVAAAIGWLVYFNCGNCS